VGIDLARQIVMWAMPTRPSQPLRIDRLVRIDDMR
jgi:hypothetical protein